MIVVNVNQTQWRKTYIDEVPLIPRSKIMDDRCLIQLGKLRHIVGFVEFAWIDFVDIFCTNFTLLVLS